MVSTISKPYPTWFLFVRLFEITQGITHKKSASGSWTLPLEICDIKVPFFPKNSHIWGILGDTLQKVPIFEDSRRCSKVLDYTLPPLSVNDLRATIESEFEE